MRICTVDAYLVALLRMLGGSLTVGALGVSVDSAVAVGIHDPETVGLVMPDDSYVVGAFAADSKAR